MAVSESALGYSTQTYINNILYSTFLSCVTAFLTSERQETYFIYTLTSKKYIRAIFLVTNLTASRLKSNPRKLFLRKVGF